MNNAEETKNRILEIIKKEGPMYVIQVSKKAGIDSLLASAFLAELVNEKKLKISYMKIGSSPLYYIPGQEKELEKFSNYLKSREKEAFLLLKEKGILEDDKQIPPIRVALRNLKDFAIGFQKDGKIMWRYAFYEEKEEPLKKQEEEKKNNEEIKKEPPQKKELPAKQNVEKDSGDFIEEVRKFLEKKNIKIIDEIQIKKREYLAIVEVNSDLGKLKFFMQAKDKKKISTDDLIDLIKKAKPYNMIPLLVSSGELAKKAEEYYQDNDNIIKFLRLK